MEKIWVAGDNGVTGSWGIVGNTIEPHFFTVPTKKELSFQKTKAKNISRIDVPALVDILTPWVKKYQVMAILERPLLNPGRWVASISAIRALEATLIVFEQLGIPYGYCDSKVWQKELLPGGLKGSADLKKASMDVGVRTFPMWEKEIRKHKDADGLLIAEYARRKNL